MNPKRKMQSEEHNKMTKERKRTEKEKQREAGDGKNPVLNIIDCNL